MSQNEPNGTASPGCKAPSRSSLARFGYAILWIVSLSALVLISYWPLTLGYLSLAQIKANMVGPPETVINDPGAESLGLWFSLIYILVFCVPIIYAINRWIVRELLDRKWDWLVWIASLLLVPSPHIVYMLLNWF